MSLICFTIQKYAFNQNSRLFHSLNLTLKTIIFILLTSIRFKVFRLSSITTTATSAPLRINGNYVGAYRIRPPRRRKNILAKSCVVITTSHTFRLGLYKYEQNGSWNESCYSERHRRSPRATLPRSGVPWLRFDGQQHQSGEHQLPPRFTRWEPLLGPVGLLLGLLL